MSAGSALLLVGCYSQELPFVKGCGDGIEAVRVDLATGEFKHAKKNPFKHHNPTYLTADGDKVYVVYEHYGDTNSVIESYNLAADGSLTLINTVDAKGTAGCYVVVDKTKKHLLCSNYMSGSAIIFTRTPDGGLSSEPSAFEQYGDGCNVNPDRQEHAHAHQTYQDPAGKYMYVPDLGTDQVLQYTFDASNGTVKPIASAASLAVGAGSGPRHMVFHPTLPYAYVVNELLSTVSTCSFDAATGALAEIQTTSALPEGVKVGVDGESFCAAIRISQDGQWLYASNRGHDTIARFQVDRTKGTVEFKECHPSGGKTPRDFDIVGNVMVVANQDSSYVSSLMIGTDGTLKETGYRFETGTPSVIAVV